MMKKIFVLLFTSYLFTGTAQPSSQVLDQLQRFNSFSTVLYMAAHPDDENTRVISWLVNGEHAKTAYLSLTRGDGGQNLIGNEFGDELGILRTQELLAARRIDGGEQYFTRAVDFGYSRNATETLEKWDEDMILSDVVWVIRKFKPQIIITRFPPDERAGHGHHTASAMLATQAIEAAADPDKFPEQLDAVSPWAVQSVYWNTSPWWDKQLEEDMKTDKSIWMADIGGYNPFTGKSHNELGSLARSQHKCQGFGVEISRGEQNEYFRHLAGKSLENGLAGIERPDWNSLGVPEIADITEKMRREFDPANPQYSLTYLAHLYNKLNELTDDYWRERKQKECAELIKMCAGLYTEAIADGYMFQTKGSTNIKVKLLSRLSPDLSIDGIYCGEGGISFKMPAALQRNKFLEFDVQGSLGHAISNPYWLTKPHGAMYQVDDRNLIGTPENAPELLVTTNLLFNGASIPLTIPVVYKWRDRVDGELQRNVVVTPPLALNFEEPMYVSVNDQAINVRVKAKWLVDSGDFDLTFKADGWDIQTTTSKLTGGTFEKEEWLTLTLKPKEGKKATEVTAYINGEPASAFNEINYKHINRQVYMPAAMAKLAYVKINIEGKKVAYIKGAGDRVADGIAQMGYEVDFLDENTISSTDLNQYQAVVVGIRAYNTLKWLPNYDSKLLKYVEAGGNVIVQYNTASRFDADQKARGPYPFKIGRGRVTEEDAKPKILVKKHPLFSTPNRISNADFNNWVQERGLYFASEWDENYDALISWHDKDREDEKGGLIITNYGKGAYIYTGISFFRQLPAGVPGAYRLLANLISYNNTAKP